MATILRPAETPPGPRSVVFQFDDLALQAASYLDAAKRESAELIAAARQEAEAIREQARSEGLRQAETESTTRLEELLTARIATLLPALHAAIAQWRDSRDEWIAAWQTNAIRLSIAIASRVLRREMHQAAEVAEDLIRESLELAVGTGLARIRLHPEDLVALGDSQAAITAAFDGAMSVEWVADASVSRGGCRLETSHGAIDQQWETQLRRIAEELV